MKLLMPDSSGCFANIETRESTASCCTSKFHASNQNSSTSIHANKYYFLKKCFDDTERCFPNPEKACDRPARPCKARRDRCTSGHRARFGIVERFRALPMVTIAFKHSDIRIYLSPYFVVRINTALA
jgi:hypothetical protein